MKVATGRVVEGKVVLEGESLQDLTTSNAVVLDQEAGTLMWPNGADFDPTTLHDWPEVCDELSSRAQAWTEPRPTNRAPTREWSRRAAELGCRAAHLPR